MENHSGHPCHLDATASIAFMIDAAFVLGRNLPETERPTESAYARDPSFAAARCPRLRRIHSLRGVFAAIARYSIALAAYSSCLQLHHIHHPLPTASPQLPATPRPSPHAISGRIMDQARNQKPRSLWMRRQKEDGGDAKAPALEAETYGRNPARKADGANRQAEASRRQGRMVL